MRQQQKPLKHFSQVHLLPSLLLLLLLTPPLDRSRARTRLEACHGMHSRRVCSVMPRQMRRATKHIHAPPDTTTTAAVSCHAECGPYDRLIPIAPVRLFCSGSRWLEAGVGCVEAGVNGIRVVQDLAGGFGDIVVA